MRPVDPLGGPIEAQAAGLALIALAIVPLAGRDVFRMGVGVTLLTLGGSLVVGAWAGAMTSLEQLAMAALLVGIAGATSLMIPSAEAVEAAELAAEGPGVRVAAPRPAKAVETQPARPQPARPQPARPQPARPQPTAPTGIAGVSPPVLPRPTETERRPRPMTADPIEPDDWLAWEAPEPEPGLRPPVRTVRRASVPHPIDASKQAPKKPTRSRPNLGGKP